jgi:hypothetical protein
LTDAFLILIIYFDYQRINLVQIGFVE